MFETKGLLACLCMFDVTLINFCNSNTIISDALGISNAGDIEIDIISIHFINSHIDYLKDIHVLRCNNVFKSHDINVQSIFTPIITIFNVLLDIAIIVSKYFINCSVSIQNCCRSYYKVIYGYCFAFVHSSMTLLSFNQLELMIYCIIEVIISNFKYRNDVCDQNKYQIQRSIRSYESMGIISMNYNVTLIIVVICTTHSCSYFIDMYVLSPRDSIIKTNCINLQAIFAAITIVHRLLEILC